MSLSHRVVWAFFSLCTSKKKKQIHISKKFFIKKTKSKFPFSIEIWFVVACFTLLFVYNNNKLKSIVLDSAELNQVDQWHFPADREHFHFIIYTVSTKPLHFAYVCNVSCWNFETISRNEQKSHWQWNSLNELKSNSQFVYRKEEEKLTNVEKKYSALIRR